MNTTINGSYSTIKRMQRKNGGFALKVSTVPARYVYSDDAGTVEDMLCSVTTRENAAAIVRGNDGATIDFAAVA